MHTYLNRCVSCTYISHQYFHMGKLAQMCCALCCTEYTQNKSATLILYVLGHLYIRSNGAYVDVRMILACNSAHIKRSITPKLVCTFV